MASPEAGGNDTQRRAYAEEQTGRDRLILSDAQDKLVNSEIYVIQTAATLRIAEDRRRYHETVLRLTVNSAVESLRLAYADDGRGEAHYDEDGNRLTF
ncbi:hypothetical protein [Candidatus Promineifilum breve]|nr:hypothetical protein [Candidatus Promineifilum breve]